MGLDQIAVSTIMLQPLRRCNGIDNLKQGIFSAGKACIQMEQVIAALPPGKQTTGWMTKTYEQHLAPESVVWS